MAPKMKKATPLGKAMVMTMGTLLLSLTPLRPVGAEILYAETAPMSFEVWAADLAPGFFLQEQTINDRMCYCKKPGSTGSSSVPLSFSFNTPSPLTSSGTPGSSFDYVFITPGGQVQLTYMPPPQNDTVTTRKECGQCNQEYTLGDANFMDLIEWKSPGWDQGQNYPDGCTCTLKVHVRLSQWGYFIYDFAAGSNIKALNNCAYDRMEVNLNGNKDIWCDANMSKYSGGEYTVGVPQDYTFTFISDAADGNQVAAGFSLTIQAYNFGRHL